MIENMFSPKDQEQIAEKGLSPAGVAQQVQRFVQGVDFIKLVRPCTQGDGILHLDVQQRQHLIARHEQAQGEKRATKFIPASGAASRMFQSLFEAKDRLAAHGKGDTSAEKFAGSLKQFAFFSQLRDLMANQGIDLENNLNSKDLAATIAGLLEPAGLGYGAKPKALLSFHLDGLRPVTPIEEHLREAAAYVADRDGEARLHFTVSPEHRKDMVSTTEALTGYFPRVQFQVGFSEQKPATDTIAVDEHNQPFREQDGSLLFRPGGHGALLENLNDLRADLIFIKNIDNVVPARLQDETVRYKKVLAGLLVTLQDEIFTLIRKLTAETVKPEDKKQAYSFINGQLGYHLPNHVLDHPDAAQRLLDILNRPIRVCGMVKNQGEPGGGPFWVAQKDGSLSVQIVESSQVNLNDGQQKAILTASTHFNPVDLVCGVRDYRGNPFDLLQFRDEDACFISEKSKDGKALKALELPGLWNGAMAYWNTVFVEVPLATFNPVKTVFDLLRPEHLA